MKELIGKTIKSITNPGALEVNGTMKYDECYLITFTDDSTLKLASWDYEGYSSGIDIEVTIKE